MFNSPRGFCGIYHLINIFRHFSTMQENVKGVPMSVNSAQLISIQKYNKRQPIPSKPRIDRSLRIVRDLIAETQINWLPVDPFEVYRHYDWALYSCTAAEEIYGKKDPFNIKKQRVDAKTFRVRETGEYITIYDEQYLEGRIRWTLAHEIGHIRLGHLVDFEETCLCRGGLTEAKYKVLEREANVFAAELLAPMAILRFLKLTTASEIADFCKTSKEAARYRERDFQLYGNKAIYLEADEFFRRQFNHFITLSTVEPGGAKVTSPYIKMRDDRRFEICPRCGNTEIAIYANFCKICGLYLYNICGEPPVFSHDNELGCINAEDARFCEYCGKETLLSRLGILKPWDSGKD